MALATPQQAETITGKTERLKAEIDAARRDAIFGTVVCDYQAVTRAFNRLDAATTELLDFQQVQLRLVEATAAWREAQDATPSAFDPADHEPEQCGTICHLHRKYGTHGREW